MSLEDTPQSSLNSATHQPSKDPRMLDLLTIKQVMLRLGEREPELAQILILFYLEGRAISEIAEILGISYKQARHRHDKGLEMLRAYFY